MNQDMITALMIDLAGTLLLVLGILGYAGMDIHPLLAEPSGYLTCGIIGLVLSGIGIRSFLSALRARSAKGNVDG